MHLPLSTELDDARGAAADRRARWRTRWPARRLVVAALLVAVAAALGAATLATYVPAPGAAWRLDLGCAPCAAAAGLTVLAATWLLALGPHQASMAVVALIVAAAGLGQRLTDSGSACLVDPR